MSILKQFNFTRTSLLTFIQELDEETLDKQSNSFDNTIRWHIGNTLLMVEKLIFISRGICQKIPQVYAELFSSDISVEDWSIEPPTLTQLVEDLINQQERI